jgi:hypothetical protein
MSSYFQVSPNFISSTLTNMGGLRVKRFYRTRLLHCRYRRSSFALCVASRENSLAVMEYSLDCYRQAKRLFSSPKRPDRLWRPPNTRSALPREYKDRRIIYLHPSPEVKNIWNFSSIPRFLCCWSQDSSVIIVARLLRTRQPKNYGMIPGKNKRFSTFRSV